MLVFYDSLVKNINGCVTDVFDSFFSFYILPACFEGKVWLLRKRK